MNAPPRLKTLLCLTCALCSTGVGSGCGTPLNTTDGLLGENPLPAVMSAPRASKFVDREPAGEIVPIDRSAWTRHAVLIDPAQVQHHPSYGWSRSESGTRDSIHEWPTIQTAFSDGSKRSDQALNGVTAPALAALELLILPFRMIGSPPWSVSASPTDLKVVAPTDDVAQTLRTDWIGSDDTNEEV